MISAMQQVIGLLKAAERESGQPVPVLEIDPELFEAMKEESNLTFEMIRGEHRHPRQSSGRRVGVQDPPFRDDSRNEGCAQAIARLPF